MGEPWEGPDTLVDHRGDRVRGPIFRPHEVVAGRFRIIHKLASGGMGEVYEAEDLALQVRVALKTVRSDQLDQPQSLEHFRREVLLARAVTHPGVCRIFDVFYHASDQGTVLFLTMELLSGETLSARLRRQGPLATAEVRAILLEMAAALEAAHEAGVIHRDLKPANVMLVPKPGGGERVVITDFGIARSTLGSGQSDWSVVGTPPYMAPEQLRGQPATPATDVWALGALLYESLTGRPPYQGATGALQAAAREAGLPPPLQAPDADPRLERAILRCLQPLPRARFGRARDLAAAVMHRRVAWPLVASALVAVAALTAAFVIARLHVSALPVLVTTQLTTSSNQDMFAAFAPDGRSVAFSSDHNGPIDVYVQDLDTGALRRLIGDGNTNVHPAWSPDGRLIAFDSPGRGIWVVAAGGGAPRQITTSGAMPAWSPDGSTLAFQTDEHVALSWTPDSVLQLVAASGGSPRPLTRAGQPAGGHGHPAWSPDGARVYFMANERVRFRIWSVAATGGAPAGIDLPTRFPSDPTFARDRPELHYLAVETKDAGIWRVAVDATGGAVSAPVQLAVAGPAGMRQLAVRPDAGAYVVSWTTMVTNLWQVALGAGGEATGEPRALTHESTDNGRPVFSPDGTQIAFYRWQPSGNDEIWVMNADGSGARQVTDDPANDFLPTWFPSGRRLGFLSNRGGHFALWAVELDTRHCELLRDLGFDLDYAALSPDGTRFVYHRSERGAVNTWVAPLGAGDPRQLTQDPELAAFPTWSPDGRSLALEVRRGSDTQIATLPLTGAEPVALTFAPGESYPHSFSPGGDKIAFAARRAGIWNVRWVSLRDPGQEHEVTHYTRLNTHVRYPAWSPRGDAIVFEHGEASGNLWLLKAE